jgi:hypothetical protein
MTHTEFESLYMSVPHDRSDLIDIAMEYHRRTETFDRTICTGPIKNGLILPGCPREMGIINQHARKVRRDSLDKALKKGYSSQELQHAIFNCARMYDHQKQY